MAELQFSGSRRDLAVEKAVCAATVLVSVCVCFGEGELMGGGNGKAEGRISHWC